MQSNNKTGGEREAATPIAVAVAVAKAPAIAKTICFTKRNVSEYYSNHCVSRFV